MGILLKYVKFRPHATNGYVVIKTLAISTRKSQYTMASGTSSNLCEDGIEDLRVDSFLDEIKIWGCLSFEIVSSGNQSIFETNNIPMIT